MVKIFLSGLLFFSLFISNVYGAGCGSTSSRLRIQTEGDTNAQTDSAVRARVHIVNGEWTEWELLDVADCNDRESLALDYYDNFDSYDNIDGISLENTGTDGWLIDSIEYKLGDITSNSYTLISQFCSSISTGTSCGVRQETGVCSDGSPRYDAFWLDKDNTACNIITFNLGNPADKFTNSLSPTSVTISPTLAPTTFHINEYGMFDHHQEDSSVVTSGSWTLIKTIQEFNQLKSDFISFYNSNKGINLIGTPGSYSTDYCGISLKDSGVVLNYNSKTYDALVPGNSIDEICNPVNGYVDSKYYLLSDEDNMIIHPLTDNLVSFSNPEYTVSADDYVLNGLYYRTRN